MSTILDYMTAEAEKKKKTIEEWLQAIAQNAEKCTTTAHVGRFVHPSANVKIRCNTNATLPNGYVATASVLCTRDILVSSASYLGTSKFLSLELEDGNTVLSHFQNDTDKIRQDLSSLSIDYQSIRNQILKIDENHVPSATDERLRQIYFPVGENQYHLLSILPASSLLIETRKRIRNMEQQARAARDKKSEHYGSEYEQIPNLTEISFGGTKPQNISTLNNANGGRAYLLPAFPPQLSQKDIRIPKQNFFQSLPMREYRPLFYTLHHFYNLKRNNIDIRNAARSAEDNIIEYVLSNVFQLRGVESGWSNMESCRLPSHQKIWLDNLNLNDRETDSTWNTAVAEEFSRWILHTYKKIMKENACPMGDGEFLALRHRIMDILLDTKEVSM